MQNIATQDTNMTDIGTNELASIDGGGFWGALGCGLLGGIVEGATNNPVLGYETFAACYY
jgi:hypothetical protein